SRNGHPGPVRARVGVPAVEGCPGSAVVALQPCGHSLRTLWSRACQKFLVCPSENSLLDDRGPILRRADLRRCLPKTDLLQNDHDACVVLRIPIRQPEATKQDLSTRFNHVALQFKEPPDVGVSAVVQNVLDLTM